MSAAVVVELDSVRPDERTIGENVLAERTVLALSLLNPRALPIARRALEPGHFWNGAHRELFELMLALDDTNAEIAPATLYAAATPRQRARVGETITGLLAHPAVSGQLGWACDLVRDVAQQREQTAIAERMSQVSHDRSLSREQMTEALARLSIEMEVAIETPVSQRPVPGLSTFDEFLLGDDVPERWVVPYLLDRQECVMILAGSGVGKSWLSRQVALNLASGLHPFRPGKRIPPRRALVADMENPAGTIRRQTQGPYGHVVRMADGEAADDRAWLWTYPKGLNVRKRPDAALFERVIDQTRPDLVCVSSLYTIFRRGRDDHDTAAEETQSWMDRMRDRYGCSFWIEHHMPRGDGQAHRKSPFGSTMWERWPGYGRVLEHVDGPMYSFTPDFREDRESGREFPKGLLRGRGELPWMPVWDEEEVDMYRKKTNGKGKTF